MADLIDDFLESVDQLPSPQVFKVWAGITMVSGALERKVWIKSLGEPFFPNLFVIMVATPGVGKSVLIKRVARYWNDLKTHNVSPLSLTKASMIDQLEEFQRNIIRPSATPPTMTFNGMQAAVDEFGIFCHTYDHEFLAVLNTLYDCQPYSERRRSSDRKVSLEKTQMTMVSGTQPATLKDIFPDIAWEQGFASRIIFLFSGEKKRVVNPLADMEESYDNEDIRKQLKEVSELCGLMKWKQDAAAALVEWNSLGAPPVPDHPKLHHYCERRVGHVLKLAMISACSGGRFPSIHLEDVERAMDWILMAEETMPQLFRAMAGSTDGKLMDDCWHHCYKRYLIDQKPILEQDLITYLSMHTDAHNVNRVKDLMAQRGLLKERLEPKVGKVYIPAMKKTAIT